MTPKRAQVIMQLTYHATHPSPAPMQHQVVTHAPTPRQGALTGHHTALHPRNHPGHVGHAPGKGTGKGKGKGKGKAPEPARPTAPPVAVVLAPQQQPQAATARTSISHPHPPPVIPPPPPEDLVPEPTIDRLQTDLQWLTEAVKQNVTTAYHFSPMSAPPTDHRTGVHIVGQYFYDKLLKRPRSQLIRYMWHTEPWAYEIGDGYAMSDSMIDLEPHPQPVLPSPAPLPTHGTTRIVLPDYYLDKKDAYDDQGLPLNFTGNQDAYLTQAVRNRKAAKSEKRQLRYWIICPTKQSFAISPIITMALDGKPVIKKLRKHCTTMLFDPSSRWYVRAPQDQHRWRERNTYQGTVNLYAFLITESSIWVDLPSIHTHRITASTIMQPEHEESTLIIRLVAPPNTVHATSFYRFINDADDMASQDAREASKLPWKSARMVSNLNTSGT